MSPRILIVDDSLTVRMDLEEATRGIGLDPTSCADLASARRSLRGRTFDLIVLDVILPDGDGIDFLRELKGELAPATPVMLLSSEADVRDRVRGMTIGADEYAGKPYDIGWVLTRARELIQSRSGQAPRRTRPTILTIDDGHTFLEALRITLTGADYVVEQASSGDVGLRMTAVLRPDAVVVDAHLPGLDGYTVVRRIKSDAALRGIPCLLLTESSVDARADEIQSLEAGADAYLRKNEDPVVVLARLRALLRDASPATRAGGATSLLGPKRILAVNDTPAFLAEMAGELRDEGYDVALATSGAEALALLRVQPVDAVVLDTDMAGTPALPICRRIKASPAWSDIPLLAMTTGDDPGALIDAMNAGADDVLVASRDFAVLKARLRAQLRRKQVEAEERRAGLEAAEARAARALAETRAALIKDLEHKNEELLAANASAEVARQLAQAESQFKSRFLTGMSHEIRTPLNAIIGFSDLLDQELFGPLNDRQRDYVRNVLTSGRHLLELVNDILDLSKVEAGRMILSREWVVPGCLMEAVVETLRPLADRKHLTLECEVAKGLPETFLDPMRFKQILFNLLSNAIKFTPDGGGVRLDMRIAGDAMIVTCRDTGIGIRKEDFIRLFREFERLERTGGERMEGTGLGLVLTKRLVECHGGSIAVESQPDVGSTFTVTLPRKPAGPTGPTDAPGGR